MLWKLITFLIITLALVAVYIRWLCKEANRVRLDPCSRKMLYQLDKEYTCSLRFFLGNEFDQELATFNQELEKSGAGKSGQKKIDFYDRCGQKVLTLMQPDLVIVSKGYKWDGCSPKFNIFDLFWIGTPDGAIVSSQRLNDDGLSETGISIHNERVTHAASAVHDVLGYCKKHPSMTSIFKEPIEPQIQDNGRRVRDLLFFSMLRNRNFSMSLVYFAATKVFGRLYEKMQGVSSTGNGEKPLQDPTQPQR